MDLRPWRTSGCIPAAGADGSGVARSQTPDAPAGAGPASPGQEPRPRPLQPAPAASSAADGPAAAQFVRQLPSQLVP